MHKIFSIFLMLMFVFSPFVLAEELETENTRTTDERPTSFWGNLFGGGLFAFTDRTAYDITQTNEARSWHGPYRYVQGESTAGDNCPVGDLVHVYVTDSDGNYITDIWQEGYTKEFENDVIELNNPDYGAWVDDEMQRHKGLFSNRAYYGYTCYQPNPDIDREYVGGRCVRDDTFCEDAYQISGVGAYFCERENSVACTCENDRCVEDDEETQPSGVGGLSARLYNIEVNGKETDTVLQGENYEVSGVLEIDGTCVGCVIETGIDLYGQELAITSREGACGDELTVGSKFNAEDEAVEFKLIDKAELRDPGRYRVDVLVYSGCADEDGVELARDSFRVTIEEPPEESAIECYYCEGGRKKSSGKVIADSCRDWARDEGYDDASENINDIQCDTGVTCWSDCQAGQTVARNFDGASCPDGFNKNKPNCEIDTVTCYQCQDGELVDDSFDRCEGNWSATPQECELSTEITCWECVDGQAVDSVVKDTSCPAGKTLDEPNCEVQTNECWWCYSYEAKSDYFEMSCSDVGLSDEEPDCAPPNPVTCYTCNVQDEVIAKEWQTSCPGGWFEDRPVCGEEQVCYWCEPGEEEPQSDTFAECPTGTKETPIDCGEPDRVDCENNPNSEACQVVQCQQGSDEPFCEVLCCDIDGESKWEYAGLCESPLSTDMCVDGVSGQTGGLIAGIVVIVVLAGFGALAYFGNRKK